MYKQNIVQKTVLSTALGLAMGLGAAQGAFAGIETVVSWELLDFDEDGLQSDFNFAGAPVGGNIFGGSGETGCVSADVAAPLCDSIAFGAGSSNEILDFTTGFNFGGSGDFNPRIFGNIEATIDTDVLLDATIDDGQALQFTSLDFGGLYQGSSNFALGPDALNNCSGNADGGGKICGGVSAADETGFLEDFVSDILGYNVEITDRTGGLYGVVVTYVGTITEAGGFAGNEANWRIEGVMKLADAPPSIALTGGNKTVPVGAPFVEDGVACTDTVDGTIQANVSGTAPVNYGDIAFTTVPLTDLTNVTADFTITYDCTDSQGQNASDVQLLAERQRDVTASAVADLTPPGIVLKGVDPVQLLVNDPYTDAGATCSDTMDGEISLPTVGGVGTPSFTVTPDPATIDTNVAGTTVLTYSCNDAAGNNATAVTRDVEVLADTLFPVITLAGDDPIVVSVGSPYIEPGGSICSDTDPLPQNPPLLFDLGDPAFTVDKGPADIDTTVAGDTTLTYTCTDPAGNIVTALRTVSVVEAQSFAIISMNITDVNGPDGLGYNFAGPPDGLAGCFRFKTLIDPFICSTAQRFASNGGVGSGNNSSENQTLPGVGADLDGDGNPIGVEFGRFQEITAQAFDPSVALIAQGFKYAGSPFVPQTLAGAENASVPSGFVSVVDQAAGVALLDLVSFPFGGVWFNPAASFFLDPDEGTLITQITKVVPDDTPGDGKRTFHYFMTWSHRITAAEDSTRSFTKNVTNWRLEGVITTEETPTIRNNTPLIDSLSAAQLDRALTQQVVRTEGEVVATVSAADPDGNAVSFDWGSSHPDLVSNVVGDTTEETFIFDPSGLEPGVYSLTVVVSDDAEQPLSAFTTLLLTVQDSAPALGDEDADGDGITDANEGFGDADDDGLPDYLDSIDGNVTPTRNRVDPRNPAAGEVVVDSGKIKLGSIASSGPGEAGFIVSEDDISERGGGDGSAVGNSLDRLNLVDGLGHSGGGIYDFVISDLAPGATARIVLPQAVPLPNSPVYRKYLASFGWKDFLIGGGNAIASAARVGGVCPGPSSPAYDDALGLVEGHDCIRLTIVDGTGNDGDSEVNGVIVDPGTGAGAGAVAKGDDGGSVLQSGGCSVSATRTSMARHGEWWLVTGFLAMLGFFRRKVYKSEN